MRLPTTLALFVSLCVPAFAAPAEVPYEQLAKRFINNIGAAGTADTIEFDAMLQEHFLHGSLGIYDVFLPANITSDDDSLEKFQTAVLALLDSQETWLEWLAPASGKQKAALKDWKIVRGWVKGWKAKALKSGSKDGERDLLTVLDASEKICEASARFSAFMASGEALGLSRESGQQEALILIPKRDQFVEFAAFCGLAFPADQGNFWHAGAVNWTNFDIKNYKVLALEYAAPVQKADGYSAGMSMDYRSPTGMAQQIVQLATNSMFDNYFGATVPPSLVGSLSLNLVLSQFGECDTRADGDLRSRRKSAREVFVPGGQKKGGQLAANLADSRWRIDRGVGHFIAPLKRAQKGGAESLKGKDKLRYFELMVDDESKRTTISGPYLGSAAADAENPPDEFYSDHVEFLRAYRACFVWWLQTTSIGSEKKSGKAFANLLCDLAASTDPMELETLFGRAYDGAPLSTPELKKDDLEGRFLAWLGKQK